MSTSASPPVARFWDRIADGYSNKPVVDEASYQRKLEITRQHLRPDMTLFEFGCGTGSTAIAHAPYVERIRATDVSSKMLEIARGKADALELQNISFERASIDEFEAPSEAFDAVLGLSILHLLRDKEAVMSKVWRMLKPGGIFVTSTVCLGGSIAYAPLRVILPLGAFVGLLPRVRFFTVKQLGESLIRAGFTIEHLWQPGKRKAVFIVAKKATVAPSKGTD